MNEKRTKIFGMDLGLDPKILVLLLILLAAGVYYFTSSSDSPSNANSSQVASQPVIRNTAANPALAARAGLAARRNSEKADRGTLKLVAVDGSRGDVDPTLHLDLLERVRTVQPAAGLRNLFDAGGATLATNVPPVPPHPTIVPKALPSDPTPINTPPPQPVAPPFSIPLKYYGFARSNGRSVDGNRGLFMDGDNILIGSEGDLLEKKYLVVALTPNMARLEDVGAKQGQDLQVTPEASSQ